MAKGRNDTNTGLELPPAVSWRMLLLPSCVITSVWHTTCTSAVGLLFPWKKRQQMFCALGVWAAGAVAGLSEQAEEGTCKSPRVGVLLPKEQADGEKTEEAPDQTTASPLYRFLAGQPLGFRNADNPELHVRRPPSACLGLASRFTSRAALLSQCASCRRPLSSHHVTTSD